MYYTYILATKKDGTLYVGVTNDLARRVYEHQNEMYGGFTSRFHVHHLVYFETYFNPKDAIRREKQLKGWRRDRKIALIESKNPNWLDCSKDWK